MRGMCQKQSASGFEIFVIPDLFEDALTETHTDNLTQGERFSYTSGRIHQRSYYIYKHTWKHFYLTGLLCHWHTSHTSGNNNPVISSQLWVALLFRLFIIFPDSTINLFIMTKHSNIYHLLYAGGLL